MTSHKPTLPPTHAPGSPSARRLDLEAAAMRRQIRELNAQVAALEEELRAMRASSSWRVSAPLRWLGGRLNGAPPSGAELRPANQGAGYADWVLRYDSPAMAALNGPAVPAAPAAQARSETARVTTPARPRFSIVIEGSVGAVKPLAASLDSFQVQSCSEWEVLVAVAAFESDDVVKVLPAACLISGRARLFDNSSAAARAAGGDWLLFLSAGDRLAPAALAHFARSIDTHPEARLHYADDDLVDAAGERSAPRFKPDWNPELMQAMDMLSPALLLAKSLIAEAGGWRPGPAASYDLALRCAELLPAAQIRHIPRILFHRAGEPADAALPAAEAQVLAQHLQRSGIAAEIHTTAWGRRVQHALPAEPPLASLIIPTRNGLELLRQCVSSIVDRSSYPNYEILLVDNGSDDPQTLAYLHELRQQPGFTVIRDDRPFNFSALNNLAARSAQGEILALINNDIEVISPDWLEEMVSLALQPGVGPVGAKLFYPDESIQHGGVLLGVGTGVGSLAGHANKFLPVNEAGYMNRAMLTQSFSAVTAACLVVRKSLYEQVGGLNEVDLKIAYNDVDFCLRLGEAGYRTVWTPYAELFHHESATRGSDMTPENRQRFEQEQNYMRQRWAAVIANDPAYNPNLTIHSEDFALAWPPRVPWISSGAKP